MTYADIDFEELVHKTEDAEYRRAAIHVHDDMLIAAASLRKLFGTEAATPERVFTVVELTIAARDRIRKGQR